MMLHNIKTRSLYHTRTGHPVALSLRERVAVRLAVHQIRSCGSRLVKIGNSLEIEWLFDIGVVMEELALEVSTRYLVK